MDRRWVTAHGSPATTTLAFVISNTPTVPKPGQRHPGKPTRLTTLTSMYVSRPGSTSPNGGPPRPAVISAILAFFDQTSMDTLKSGLSPRYHLVIGDCLAAGSQKSRHS